MAANFQAAVKVSNKVSYDNGRRKGKNRKPFDVTVSVTYIIEQMVQNHGVNSTEAFVVVDL
jgi:hypothetical protein